MAAFGLADRLGAISAGQTERMSLAALRELVQHELVRDGEVSDAGFAPGSEPLEQSLVWLGGGGQVEERDQRGFSCWLSNTRRAMLARGGCT